MARGGTVFLDEIAELPVELQAKLLRALQEREVRAIGGNEWTRLDARVIAATNQDINEAIKHGSFRKDLYFRLNVLSIHLPPLRERKSDIPALVHDFLARYAGDVLVFGHTHRALIAQNAERLVVNPGAAGPRRFDVEPSVARLTIAGGRAEVEIVAL